MLDFPSGVFQILELACSHSGFKHKPEQLKLACDAHCISVVNRDLIQLSNVPRNLFGHFHPEYAKICLRKYPWIAGVMLDLAFKSFIGC